MLGTERCRRHRRGLRRRPQHVVEAAGGGRGLGRGRVGGLVEVSCVDQSGKTSEKNDYRSMDRAMTEPMKNIVLQKGLIQVQDACQAYCISDE